MIFSYGKRLKIRCYIINDCMYFQIIASGTAKNSLSQKIFEFLIENDHECDIFVLKQKGVYSSNSHSDPTINKDSWVGYPTSLFTKSRHPDLCLVRGVGTHIISHIFYRLDYMSILEELGVRLINTRRCMELATNKMLTTVILHKNNILSPETAMCETAERALEAFYNLGQDVVLKPLYGARGKDIIRINNDIHAKFVFEQLEALEEIFYIQKYYEHGNSDYRLFVVNGEVIASMKRVSNNWKTNIATGAIAEKYHPSQEMIELATKSCEIVHGEIMGVDIMNTEKGLMVIEVNAVPGYEGLQKANPEINIPAIIGNYLIKEAKK